jgi:hypothetical protein
MRYTTEEMLVTLKSVAIQLGRPPSRIYWEEHSDLRPSARSYALRFGSWNKALKTAGLVPLRENAAREEVVADVMRVAAELNRTPLSAEYEELGNFSLPTVRKYVGRGWVSAMKSIGLEPPHNSPITAGMVVASLKAVAEELGHTPILREYNDHPLGHSTDVLYKHFTSFDTAITAADLPLPHRNAFSGKPTYTEDELLQRLAEIANELGRSPTQNECVERGLHWATLSYRFGSFGKALNRIGLETCKLNGYAWAGNRSHTATDGHIVQSLPELGVDEFLSSNGFEHDVQVRVCQERTWTCDFVVKVHERQLWLEVDGFVINRPQTSANSLNNKLSYYSKNGYDHLVVKPFTENWQIMLLNKLKSL